MFRSSSISDDDYKMVILMRNDLKMTKGKMAAQAGHAAVNCAFACKKKDPKSFDAWNNKGQTKIVLRVDSESELFQFKALADAQGIINSIIRDAGHTQVDPGTHTCLGLGPAKSSLIDKITGDLKMI